jgi:DNA primase
MNCEEIKNSVSIRSVLESFQIFPTKENQKTAFYFAIDREEKTASFCVDYVKNTAYDFGTGKSYDVISIVQQIKKCSVSAALKYLENFNSSFKIERQNEYVKPQKNYEIIQVKEVEHLALVQYLEFRKVLEQKHLVKEIHYKMNSKKYFGIGFFNNSGGVEIRNKYSKICLGKKDITLIKNEKNPNIEIRLFEGFFDYLTFKNIEKENSSSDYVILNSTSMLFKAEELLKNYEKISLFLDNDSNGKETKDILQKKYKNVEDCSFFYNRFKDLNDWYCNINSH